MVFNVQYSEDHPFRGWKTSEYLRISEPYDENRMHNLRITTTVGDLNNSSGIIYV